MKFFKRLNFLRVKTRFDAQKITIIQFRNGQKIDSVWGTNRVTWSELEDLCGRSTALSSPFSRNRNWKTEIQMLAIEEFVMTYLFNDKLLRIVSQYEYVFPKSSRFVGQDVSKRKKWQMIFDDGDQSHWKLLKNFYYTIVCPHFCNLACCVSLK